ncbi:5-deoxy-glucuronate isomerase [Alicyclobacillus sendaiensis]|uniref:5-deoxy-glucuronate isomerase n=1 Tax=Alicyclobacillus sendaiensis PA2 TaxID=3029425 RepID=A0ABT6Y1J7_ALISE|nr:5-deoxy-glucuronate isomerase [Alicyclobacillus sendaiensis]MDI9261220.1 5-deoxy-glucuronate isomerase [Alicyclobacillus sendaiensis PA2]
MADTLLRRPVWREEKPGVTVIQDVSWENEALKYTGLKVIRLQPGSHLHEKWNDREACVVVIAGKVEANCGGDSLGMIGRRRSVFDRCPTDSVYVPLGIELELIAAEEACVAIAWAPTEEIRPVRLILAEENLVERRGKYQNQRIVHNILSDTDRVAHRLLVVEVFTDGGHWSSYPPHKHDRDRLPEESFLEEIYYHEIDPPQGFVMQRIYTDDGTLDESYAVQNRNVVLVPRGYHPVGVPDGYTSYYLNVMAGPIRVWRFHNDPAHEWILARP